MEWLIIRNCWTYCRRQWGETCEDVRLSRVCCILLNSVTQLNSVAQLNSISQLSDSTQLNDSTPGLMFGEVAGYVYMPTVRELGFLFLKQPDLVRELTLAASLYSDL